MLNLPSRFLQKPCFTSLKEECWKYFPLICNCFNKRGKKWKHQIFVFCGCRSTYWLLDLINTSVNWVSPQRIMKKQLFKSCLYQRCAHMFLGSTVGRSAWKKQQNKLKISVDWEQNDELVERTAGCFQLRKYDDSLLFFCLQLWKCWRL